jgi:phosphoglycolate phosphatase-like HAD superfamily hydrolase
VAHTIVLFDVDQTLLYSGGAGGLAMRRAFERLYGVQDGFRQVEFSGRTDWAILRDALRLHGLLDGQDEAAFRRGLTRFQQTYVQLLPETLREVDGGRVMPGVPALLEALAARDDVRLGLATGNFRDSCFLKLRHFRLDCYFIDGGFGDDSEDRAEVVRLAIARVGDASHDPRSVWVVGDTPRDIAAAHANRARALGVATGSCSVEELRAAGADLAMADLSQTADLLRALVGD